MKENNYNFGTKFHFKSGIITLNGKVLLPVEFEQNIFIYDQAIYVTQDGLIGVFSLQYKLIAKPF